MISRCGGRTSALWVELLAARVADVTIHTDNVPEGTRPDDNETGMRSTHENLARFVREHGSS